MPPPSPRSRRTARALVLSLAIALAGCGSASVGGANLVVIGIDTLRADHLGCYGYKRPTSPRIDAFSREAVLFTTAISQSPWTLPAFASMFTGLLPSSHRAGEGEGFERSRLEPTHDTLATVLRGAGYRTGSFVSNGFVGQGTGLTEGFEKVVQVLSGEAATTAAISWLRSGELEPFFLFLHIVDPHHPYSPPEEQAAPFLDRTYQGPIGTWFDARPDSDLSEGDRRRIIDLYDGEVRFADSLVGRVLDTIEALDAHERTVIVVTSDHGEELFDHGTIGHGHSLHDELLRVPLIIRWPGGTPRARIEDQVRTMDLFPTLLDTLALPVPPELDGVSLMPLARGEPHDPATETALAEYLFPSREQKAIRQANRKFILTRATNEGALFDLRADPGETRDVAAAQPTLVRELRRTLDRTLLATAEGFRLLVRGGREEHWLAAQFRTGSRFSEFGLEGLEPPDRYKLSADGRVIEVHLNLAPGAEQEGEPDDDGIRFLTEDAGAVEARVLLDDVPFPPERLALGAAAGPLLGAQPWLLESTDPRLIVPMRKAPTIASDGQLQAMLLYVQRPHPSIAAIDEKTQENLRALGYVE